MIHGIGTGTDLRFGWMQILVAACIVSVLAALAWRIRAHPYPGGHRTAVPAVRRSRRPVTPRSGGRLLPHRWPPAPKCAVSAGLSRGRPVHDTLEASPVTIPTAERNHAPPTGSTSTGTRRSTARSVPGRRDAGWSNRFIAALDESGLTGRGGCGIPDRSETPDHPRPAPPAGGRGERHGGGTGQRQGPLLGHPGPPPRARWRGADGSFPRRFCRADLRGARISRRRPLVRRRGRRSGRGRA